MKNVPISVVIPAYNAGHFIGEAIRSVQAQTLGVDEIIVVDNNCTDATRKITANLGAKIFEEKKQGVSAARNRGISVCRNDWIAFLDADDLWEREKIKYQWEAIKKFPDARIISSDSGWISAPDYTKHPVPIMNTPEIDGNDGMIIDEVYSYSPKFTAELCEWFLINSSTKILHREVFARVGLFDETFLYAQDMEFIYRALARFPIATVKKNLAYIRRHDQNRTFDVDAYAKFRISVGERMLQYPDLYPPGIPEYFIEYEKKIFLERGRWLARKKRESEKSGSDN